jgi:hypothetical protein
MAKAVKRHIQTYDTVEGHEWENLLCVEDQLVVKLKEIRNAENGKFFTYEYTEEFSPLGHRSTKHGKTMSLRFDILSEDVKKGIFKPIKSDK